MPYASMKEKAGGSQPLPWSEMVFEMQESFFFS